MTARRSLEVRTHSPSPTGRKRASTGSTTGGDGESETVLLCAHNLADGYREAVVGFDVDPDTVERVVGDGGYHVAEGGVTFLLDACDYVWLRGEQR